MNGSVIGLMVAVMAVVALGVIAIYVAAGGRSADDPDFRRELEDAIRSEPGLKGWPNTRKYQYVQKRTGVSLQVWNELYPRWSVSRQAAEDAGFTGPGRGLGPGWAEHGRPHSKPGIDFTRRPRSFRNW